MSQWSEADEVRRYGDLVDFAARRFGDREGLSFQGRRYSFREIQAETDLAARALIGAGVAAGDHVALWINNSADWIFILFGAAKIGAVIVPINTRFRTHDLAYVLRQSDSAFLITHDVSGPIDYLAMTREVVDLPTRGDRVRDPRFPALRQVLILGEGAPAGARTWSAAKAAADDVPRATLAARAAAVRPDDVVLIMYTSGTTGFPKGAMHDHRAIRNVEERAYRMAMTRNDVILNYLPLFHLFGFSEGPMMSFVSGARQVLTETFDPDASLDLVAAEGVTVIYGFEAHVKGLCEAQEAKPRDLSSLRTGLFAAGARSATPVLYRADRTLAPVKPVSGFGMTETWIGVAFTGLHATPEERYEASGYPGLGYDVRIAEPETGRPLAPGEEGEIQVRGRYLMLGYYKKPEETVAAYTDDGWFRTGDAGCWTDRGYLRFLGRYKDMLKVGGENVDPMEVECLLLAEAEIKQVAVVGCPDPRLAEAPVAYVELERGMALSAEEVIARCRGKVASFKLPRHVVFVENFPMTASGKIRKVELREDAARRFGREE